MDKLLKKRSVIRTQFTKGIKACKCNLNAVAFEALKLRFNELEVLNNQIVDILLDSDEGAVESDLEDAEKYRLEFVEVEMMLNGTGRNGNDQHSGEVKSILPKLKLQQFDLSCRTWIAFWGQFSRIHEDDKMATEDKFQFLLNSLIVNSRGYKIVNSYPPNRDNYNKVIETLKNRFGREDLLVELYCRELVSLVLKKQSNLSVLYDTLNSKLQVLESLGVTSNNYAAMLLPLVESAVPSEILLLWERKRGRSIENSVTASSESLNVLQDDSLKQFLKFLENEVISAERVANAQSFSAKQKETKSPMVEKVNDQCTAAALLMRDDKCNCIFCGLQHLSVKCTTAKELGLEQRLAKIREARACFTCLNRGHQSRFCRVKVKCDKCGKRHTALLCRQEQESPSTVTPSAPLPACHAGASSSVIYLKTLVVRVLVKGKVEPVRALLDDGCSRSYITKGLASRLNLQPIGSELTSHTLFGGVQTSAIYHNVYSVQVFSAVNDFSCLIEVLDSESLCCSLPRVNDFDLLNSLKERGIVLSDVGFGEPPIEILLGSQSLGKLLTGRIEVFPCGISAIESKLGWSILGAMKAKAVVHTVNNCMFNRDFVQNLWNLEAIGITDDITVTKDSSIEDAQNHFRNTIRMIGDKYEVQLPWLIGHPPLANNFESAEVRLRSVSKRLLRKGKFLDYNKVFQEWKNEGLIECVDINEASNGVVHYLPHRPVYKDSATTKIRPVFDASACTKDNVSLNDCLSTGPNMIAQVPDILLRFRIDKVGITGDIRKAFQMIHISEKDKDSLRFLWWKNGKPEEIQIMRHCTVPFGIRSSPFLLNATIAFHLDCEEKGNRYSCDFVEKLRSSFYVDDCITSVSNSDRAEFFIRDATDVMAKGGFELRSWVRSDDQMVDKQKSVLGINWLLEQDELSIVMPSAVEKSVSKRRLLSFIGRVYDPIGLSVAAMLVPKLILQEAWRRHVGWDEELPLDLVNRFVDWQKNLTELSSCRVKRQMHHGESDMECCELHVFCDASCYAYAACCYVKCGHSGRTDLSLVAAKARLGPIDKCSIPRMELLGALIAVRLADSVLKGLKRPLSVTFWTDSMVVLGWITSDKSWKPWVGNRVREIREKSNISSWKHVPGELNVADLASRGCDFKRLRESDFISGPFWLLNEGDWPEQQIFCPEEALTEVKCTPAMINLDVAPFSKSLLTFCSRYKKLVNVTAWIFRFKRNCSRIKQSGPLTAQEVEAAEMALFYLIQSEWSEEAKNRSSSSVQLFRDDKGLLRVKTKLLYSDETEGYKCPIVLQDHAIVRKLILFHHEQGHIGVQTTLNKLRETVWILQGRRIVRKVINDCYVCKRFRVKNVIPEPAPLPRCRITLGIPFEVTGVDLAGPLYLKGKEKAWIVLFTCAVYRAIHLELVTSLSTECFLMSFRRFQARRGKPRLMISDNGSNFTGSAALLRSLDWDKITGETAAHKLKWQFNPPAAPNFGGFFERLIGVVKGLLRKNLGRAFLTYEELLTVLCSCESDVNSRPLTYQYDDAEELRPITPMHFLLERPSDAPNEFEIVDRTSLLKRIRYRQEVIDKFKKRFHDEYISVLAGRAHKVGLDRIVPGEIVIVATPDRKRVLWPLGKVEAVFEGADGVGRVARVKLRDGEITRPVNKLHPLEVAYDEKETREELVKLAPSSPKSQKPRLDSSEVRTASGRVIKPAKRLNL